MAENRYRESYGRYFEDFEVGQVYEHRPGRTITEFDNIQFSLLTMNRHPLHCDAVYAEKSEFGKPLVNSGLSGDRAWNERRRYQPEGDRESGMEGNQSPRPRVSGRYIYAESEVLEKRESRSRPNQGIVTVRTTGKKADGTIFMTFIRSALIPKRGHGTGDSAAY